MPPLTAKTDVLSQMDIRIIPHAIRFDRKIHPRLASPGECNNDDSSFGTEASIKVGRNISPNNVDPYHNQDQQDDSMELLERADWDSPSQGDGLFGRREQDTDTDLSMEIAEERDLMFMIGSRYEKQQKGDMTNSLMRVPEGGDQSTMSS